MTAHSNTLPFFDPVVSRLVTDITSGRAEPPYAFDAWAPSIWDLVNSVQTPQGIEQRLVIVPGQYWSPRICQEQAIQGNGVQAAYRPEAGVEKAED